MDNFISTMYSDSDDDMVHQETISEIPENGVLSMPRLSYIVRQLQRQNKINESKIFEQATQIRKLQTQMSQLLRSLRTTYSDLNNLQHDLNNKQDRYE